MRNKLITIGLLVLIILITLWLRAGVPFNSVFTSGDTRFIETDAYYHMRLADSLNANFPNDITFDPYLGDDVTMQPLLHWVIVLIGKVTGNIDAVGAWIPPICAALIALVAFFIGRELFRNRWIGLLSALLFVVIPGETHGRTLLGFTDHHCLEILFAGLLILFIILGLTRSKWYWTGILPVSALFWLSWSGFPLFIGIMALLTLVWLAMTRKWGWFILCFAVPAVMVFSIIVISPQTFNVLLQFAVHGFGMVFSIGGAGGSIMEAQYLTWDSFWGNFNLIGIIGVLGIGVALRKRTVPLVLFAVYTLVIIVITIFQRRFAYYLSVEFAVLCAYLCWTVVKSISSTVRNKKLLINWTTAGFCSIVLFSSLVVPNAMVQVNTSFPYQITPAWESCLHWLRYNSPEPFNSKPNFYYADYDIAYRIDSIEKGDLHRINANAYRVLSWWDYGHWIVRIGHRPIACSPAGGQTILAAKYLLSNGRSILDDDIKLLRVRYIIVDYYMVTGKFYAIPLWAGMENVQKENTLVYQLFYGKYDQSRFREVWSSNEQYMGQSQVKVFEVIGW